MKKTEVLILALFAAAALSACAAAQGGPAESGVPQEDPVSVVESAEPLRQAFGKVLWDVYLTGTLPDGAALDWNGRFEPEAYSGNHFAVFDVDGDGQEELLLFWETAATAGMTARVFGWDGTAVYEKLTAFPSLRFYDNGVAEEDASHNQNLAGDFWPYFVHQYDEQSGVYQCIGGVDAWDKRVRQTNAADSIFPARFPSEIDADGDGVVYFLLPADWDGYYTDVPMVDGADYERWRSAYLDGAQELSLPRQTLTEEHIASLGYPKPDVQYPEPAG